MRTLADGAFHSGEALAEAAGRSRAAVWHAIRDLEAGGLVVYKVRGRGYRLQQPLDVLDAAQLARCLGPAASRFTLLLPGEVDSTNTALLSQAAAGAPAGTVIAAEAQTAGRGRMGRAWASALGTSLTFSLLWRFEQGAGWLGGLSLAAGLAVVRVLRARGVPDAGLKWPNDVVWRGCKLAGILIELQGEAMGPSAAVIGVGLNVRLSTAVRDGIDQAVSDVERASGAPVERNALLAAVLVELAAVLDTFARAGLTPLREEWMACDAYAGREVQVRRADGRVEAGIARGIAEDGALLLANATGIARYHSGEVSLRPVPAREGAA